MGNKRVLIIEGSPRKKEIHSFLVRRFKKVHRKQGIL